MQENTIIILFACVGQHKIKSQAGLASWHGAKQKKMEGQEEMGLEWIHGENE